MWPSSASESYALLQHPLSIYILHSTHYKKLVPGSSSKIILEHCMLHHCAQFFLRKFSSLFLWNCHFFFFFFSHPPADGEK